jgi:hypothetical protein
MIGRRLRQRFPGSGRARAIPCKFSGSACDCDRLRCAEPMHREGVRINLAPDAKQADTIVIGDGDRGGTGCDEIRAPPVSTSVIIAMCKNPRERCRAAYVLQAPSSTGTYSAHGPILGDQGQETEHADHASAGT